MYYSFYVLQYTINSTRKLHEYGMRVFGLLLKRQIKKTNLAPQSLNDNQA